MSWLRIVRIPFRGVVVVVGVPVAVVPVVVTDPPVSAACNCCGVGSVMPIAPSCCLASASEMKTLP